MGMAASSFLLVVGSVPKRCVYRPSLWDSSKFKGDKKLEVTDRPLTCYSGHDKTAPGLLDIELPT